MEYISERGGIKLKLKTSFDQLVDMMVDADLEMAERERQING